MSKSLSSTNPRRIFSRADGELYLYFLAQRAGVDRDIMDRAHGPGGLFDVAFDQCRVVGIRRYILGGRHTFYLGKQDQILAVTLFETEHFWNVQLAVKPFENRLFMFQIGRAAGRRYFQICGKIGQVIGLGP